MSTLMEPELLVNLTAFERRLIITSLILVGSPLIGCSSSGSMKQPRSICFSLARTAYTSTADSNSSAGLNTISSISSLLDSILERSRMLLIISRRFSDDFSIISTNSVCSSFRPVSLRSSVNPTIPLRGVRISCDIFARNIDFASEASCADSLSCRVCSIIRSSKS